MLRCSAVICSLLASLIATPLSLASGPRPHSVALGSVRIVPYSVEGDPSSAHPDESKLRVRPLVVDGKVKDWTTGDLHEVTERSFTIRRALRLNDALPSDHGEHWVWQRGPWLLIDRTSGKITALRLPDFNPAVSDVVWFRDYAAYCGLSASGKQLYAVVAQIEARKPVLSKKLSEWGATAPPSPACGAATWQREPLQISFSPTGASPVSFNLAGPSAVLVEEDDAPPANAPPASQ